MKARDVSLWIGKVGAVAYSAVMVALKGLGIVPGLQIWDILATSIVIAALFSDVSINVLLEKFTGKPKDPSGG